MGVAALVLGIVSVVFSFIPGIQWLGAIIGIIGIVLAAMEKKPQSKSIATAGLVLSIIGTVLCVLTFIACMACASASESAIKTLNEIQTN